jgi:GPI mannosyltransferase 3
MKYIQNFIEQDPHFHKKCLILGALLHFFAVIFSEGYDRPDEHLGMLRFARYFLGHIPASDLSWEFPTQIRPWAQPLLYGSIMKLFYAVNIKNPFTIMFFLRLFTSILSFSSLYLFYKATKRLLSHPKWQKYYFFTLLNLSFFPFFHARTTAENFGITFFIFGVSILLPYIPKTNFIGKNGTSSWTTPFNQSVLAGLFMGLSFVFRFQMGVMVFSALFWMLFISGQKIKSSINILFGVLISLLIMVVTDYWGYQTWTFTPYNYVYQNIFKGMASGFGVSPWYYYIEKTFLRGVPPLSLIFIIPSLWLLRTKPFHLLNFLIWPYFIIHSAISHKEIRFIFALGVFSPLMLWMMVESSGPWIKKFLNKKSLVKFLITLAVIQNFAFIFISSGRPAFGPIPFYKSLYQMDPPLEKLYTLGVFRDQLKFYLKRPIEQIVMTEHGKINALINTHDTASWFLMDKYQDIKFFKEQKNCVQHYSSYPDWMVRIHFHNWPKRSKIWSLFSCKKS